MKNQRILVTGGAGFIGAHTVRLLLEEKKEVVILDNLSAGKLDHLDLNHPNLELIEGDVLEYPLVVDLIKTVDSVLHLAAIPSVAFSIENPIYSFQVNTQGFLHVLHAVQTVNPAIRLVYASSAAVYGNEAHLPNREIDPISTGTLSPYALQKRQAEEYAEIYAKIHQQESLGLRYFNVYGGVQADNSLYSGVINRFIEAYAANEALAVFGNGLQTRDFIHVEDVARVNCLALASQKSGILNIGTGQSKNLLEVVKEIELAGHKKAIVKYESEKRNAIEASLADTNLARQLLGFKAEITFEDGIKRMVDALTNRAVNPSEENDDKEKT